MPDAGVVKWVQEKYQVMRPALNERTRRLWAAAEARSLGRGGVAAVMAATGMSSATVDKGLRELDAWESGSAVLPPERSRQPGGGRKRARDQQRGLAEALRRLVEPTARGDPQRPLRWTCKSTSKLAAELRRQGFRVGPRTVAKELAEQAFSLQANRKTREGASHRDRDAQFAHINEEVLRFQRRGQPAISVDTKKKELVGDFKNAGREWRRRGRPEEVRVHDFPDPKMNKAIPYGVYDLTRNEGWVSVGIDHDTARFAAASIKRWWKKMGRKRYPDAKELLITADCGGSNSSRTRLWKVALQDLADDLGLRLTVCHFPPGTSKWNKIEHRMFCHITQNWRGRPLTSYAVIVQLIGNTKTTTGLRIRSELDEHTYATQEQVTPAQLANVRLTPAAFHGEWNYAIAPN
ncbi:MAG: ISAzo13 family transposase [Tepidisphaeraceae bacterium]